MENTLSLCMIVKNESKYLDNCLSSISDIVDEIIIVDTGSTDNTKEIASKYTNKIFDFKWINDFGKARNFSFSKATCSHIMWLDADDVLLESDRQKLKEIKKEISSNGKENVISMIYDYAFNSNGNVTLSLRRNRIVPNNPKKYYWVGFVHEILDININNSRETDIHITHTRTHSNGTRNLDLFEAKLKEGWMFDTRNTLYYAKELYYNNKLSKAADQFEIFLSKKDVWVEDVIDVYVKLSDIYRIWKNVDKERECLYSTFKYALRAEALFPLALTFTREKDWDKAIFFLEGILRLEFPKDCSGFIKNDLWNIKPLIELSCCYYYKGDIDKAREYHNKAKQLDPNNETILYNDQFFN